VDENRDAMMESPIDREFDRTRLSGLETEVRELRTELRRVYISLWRLIVAIVVLIGLRDRLGDDFWRVGTLFTVFAAPVVTIVLLLRWLLAVDNRDVQQSHAERIDSSIPDTPSV